MSAPVQELPVAPPTLPPRRPRSILPLEMTAGWVGIIVFLHALYGLMIARSSAIATAHALLTLALAIWIALTSTMRRVAFVCAYIAGSEILWRLGKASLPWEFGKYAICLVIFLTFLRTKRLKWDWPVIAYFALLIPSTIISFSEQPFDFARKQVSFNLSGPLTLSLATWFFSAWHPSREDIQRIFVALLAPIASLAAIAVTHTASLEDLSFTDASNSQTSAGYGPNQVSTMLGLGALLTVLLILLLDRGVRERILYAGLGVLFAVESALTFSRGGLFSAFGALLFAAPFVVSGARSRVALLVGAAVLVGTVEIVILPRLDSFTQGALSERFHDTNPTGRDVLIRTELETFAQNPIFGTGPAALDDYGDIASSVHTEFTQIAGPAWGIRLVRLSDDVRDRSERLRAATIGGGEGDLRRSHHLELAHDGSRGDAARDGALRLRIGRGDLLRRRREWSAAAHCIRREKAFQGQGCLSGEPRSEPRERRLAAPRHCRADARPQSRIRHHAGRIPHGSLSRGRLRCRLYLGASRQGAPARGHRSHAAP